MSLSAPRIAERVGIDVRRIVGYFPSDESQKIWNWIFWLKLSDFIIVWFSKFSKGPIPAHLERVFLDKFGYDMMILFGEPMPSVNTWFTANARAITKTRSAGIRNNISNSQPNVYENSSYVPLKKNQTEWAFNSRSAF